MKNEEKCGRKNVIKLEMLDFEKFLNLSIAFGNIILEVPFQTLFLASPFDGFGMFQFTKES